MSLLDKEVEHTLSKEAGAKIKFFFDEKRLDADLLKKVGKFLGTTTARSTIRLAFIFAVSNQIKSGLGLLEHSTFDEKKRLFDVIEQRENAEKTKESQNMNVSLLRWNLMVLAAPLLQESETLNSTEEIANTTLRLCYELFHPLLTNFRKR